MNPNLPAECSHTDLSSSGASYKSKALLQPGQSFSLKRKATEKLMSQGNVRLALLASGVPGRLAADMPCFCLFLPPTVGPHSSVLSLSTPGTMELPATVNEEQGEDHNQDAYTQYLPCQQTCVPGICWMEGSGSLCDVNSKMSRGGVHMALTGEEFYCVILMRSGE